MGIYLLLIDNQTHWWPFKASHQAKCIFFYLFFLQETHTGHVNLQHKHLTCILHKVILPFNYVQESSEVKRRKRRRVLKSHTFVDEEGSFGKYNFSWHYSLSWLVVDLYGFFFLMANTDICCPVADIYHNSDSVILHSLKIKHLK